MKSGNFIENCFKHPLLRQTNDNYRKVWQKKDGYPYFNYFGVNFDERGVVSVKFYFHVFRYIEPNEAALFLPTLDDFEKYYHLYQESKGQTLDSSGCAFELKFLRDGDEPVKGFHFRLLPNAESYKLIGLPKRIPLTDFQNWLRPGINYEYRGKEVLRKTYYYFTQEEHKAYFAKRFGLEFLIKAALIEYSESQGFCKINTWYGTDLSMAKVGNILSEDQILEVDRLCNKYGFNVKAYGYYEGLSVKAVYFMVNGSNVRGSSESSVELNALGTKDLWNLLNHGL